MPNEEIEELKLLIAKKHTSLEYTVQKLIQKISEIEDKNSKTFNNHLCEINDIKKNIPLTVTVFAAVIPLFTIDFSFLIKLFNSEDFSLDIICWVAISQAIALILGLIFVVILLFIIDKLFNKKHT